jgi:hypothetical protein
MTDSFLDKFNRADGALGTSYMVPCGQARIFDEAVLPVNVEEVNGSEVLEASLQRTQVIYIAEALDGPDQIIRGVWGHDAVSTAGLSKAPAFTLMARATKDPLVIDLAPPEESPDCLDQFYGLRVTCPLDGSAPILKLIKKAPYRRVPNLTTPTSAEPDNAIVLASVTLQAAYMNVDSTWDGTGNFPYRGFWQDMRLRVRRGDNQVILEAYLNDQFENTPILTYTDYQDPLWSVIGVPGIEFLSATLTNQPADASPFALEAQVLMRCTLFAVQTIKTFEQPRLVQPTNLWTYDRVVQRVITLVEKDGDSVYTQSNSGSTKREVYLNFVIEAEMDIIRTEGYWEWTQREGRIYLKDQIDTYELPEDCGEIILVRPGNYVLGPLREFTIFDFNQAIAGRHRSGGKPSIYVRKPPSVNNRPTIRVFPAPLVESITTPDQTEGPYLVAEYHARQLFPTDATQMLPFVPQEDIDVLIYGAAAHAEILDTDEQNAARMAAIFNAKKMQLRRKNNRKISSRQTVMRSAADVFVNPPIGRVPELRSTQLGLFFP